MKTIVVAMDKNNGIGADNDLLWKRDLPADLAHFKKLTIGRSIIMGRKTFESIGRALPDRQNIVVSSRPTGVKGIITANSVEAAYDLAQYDVAIIGGEKLYSKCLEDVEILHVTEVDAAFPEATVFFPQIDSKIWLETAREHHEADKNNKFALDFVTYKRI